MGLHIDVYRSSHGDCTNGGISSKARSLVVVNVDGPFSPSPDAPAAFLVRGLGPKGTVRIVPAISDGMKWVPSTDWTMMGGNYAGTSDGRFGRAVEELLGHAFYGAVAIHDRIE